MQLQTNLLNWVELPDLLAFALTQDAENLLLAFDTEAHLLLLDSDTKTIKLLGQYPELLLFESKTVHIQLHIHKDFVAIVQDYANLGLLVNWKTQTALLSLNRRDYHTQQSQFPLAFVEKGEAVYLLHATNWNEIVATNLSETTDYRKQPLQSDLDYFFSTLSLSTNQKWVLSNGWVWGAAAQMLAWSVDELIASNANAYADYSKTRAFTVGSYYWDRAGAWATDDHFLFWYNPAEESEMPQDNEVFYNLGITEQQGYALLWNMQTDKMDKVFPLPHFAENNSREASWGRFHIQQNYLLAICEKNGLVVYDWKSGECIASFLDAINLGQYEQQSQKFYQYHKGEGFRVTALV